jgi:hypothetical protein
LGTTEFQIGAAASTAQNHSRASGQPFVMRVASPNGSALLAMGNFSSAEREGTEGVHGTRERGARHRSPGPHWGAAFRVAADHLTKACQAALLVRRPPIPSRCRRLNSRVFAL